MWCNCIENKGIRVGCYNHNISATIRRPLIERVKVNGVYVDFNNIQDVIMLVRQIDDPYALDFDHLSIQGGQMEIVTSDPTYLNINFTTKIYEYTGKQLFYELYIKENDNLYPVQKGKILIRKSFD